MLLRKPKLRYQLQYKFHEGKDFFITIIILIDASQIPVIASSTEKVGKYLWNEFMNLINIFQKHSLVMILIKSI